MRLNIIHILPLILILCICLFFYLQYKVISMQNFYMPSKSDCIIILGHSMENGSMPSAWLARRLETGLSLYNSGFSNKIIVTGGRGPSDSMPVAQSMQQWLINKGVSEINIITEINAQNTYENFLFSKNLAEAYNLNSAIVVTNDFHMYRSMLIAKDFFESVTGQSANIDMEPRKILAYAKEPLSLIKYALNIYLIINKLSAI